MACTCNKSHSHSNSNSTSNRCCNSCTDVGCKNIVYPKCIITDSTYPCIGVGSGKTGSVLFAAIDNAICALQSKSTVVEGCTQALDNGDYITITSTPTVSAGITTYTVCLGDDVISFFNAVQSSLTSINSAIDSTSACLFDSTGGCQVDNIEVQITSINGDITTIQGDITNINEAISDIITNGTWKVIGGGGNFDAWQGVPGPAVPSLGTGISSPSFPLESRKRGDGTIDFIGVVEITNPSNVFSVLNIGTPMPTGYRPSRNMAFPLVGWVAGAEKVVGQLTITTGGIIGIAYFEQITLTGVAVFPININYPTD